MLPPPNFSLKNYEFSIYNIQINIISHFLSKMGDIFDFESKNLKKNSLNEFYKTNFSNKKFGITYFFKNFIFQVKKLIIFFLKKDKLR